MGTNRTPSFERRAARRFTVPLRIEVWSRGQERTTAPKLEVKDFSRRGFYFFSELKREFSSKLNFVVVFRQLSSKKEVDLLRGVAQIVRCEDLGSKRTDRFGIAAKIDETTYEVGDELGLF